MHNVDVKYAFLDFMVDHTITFLYLAYYFIALQFINNKFKLISSFSPKVNLYEDETKYFIHVELPGMTKNQVKTEINEKDRLLTISGEKISTEDKEHVEESSNESNDYINPKETNSNKKYLLIECFYGKFNRTITLPEEANLDSIQANMENGLLEITISKVELLKTKKRAIKIQ